MTVYDLNGNRLQKAVVKNGLTETTNYEYNVNDQLIRESSDSQGVTNYEYDTNGSLIRKSSSGNFDYHFAYNLQNRLANVNIVRKENNIDLSIACAYEYDSDGNRIRVSQAVNGGTTQNRFFLLDKGHTGFAQVLEELSDTATIPIRSYVLGDDIISQNSNEQTYYFLYDGHGSTRQLTDNAGSVIESYHFDAYGQMLAGNPGVTNPAITDFLYAGEQFDAGLQMEYLRSRYYDPSTGRFNRLDTFGGFSDDPQSIHKYAYAHCDPINGIDPSGQFIGVLVVAGLYATYNFAVALKARSIRTTAEWATSSMREANKKNPDEDQDRAAITVHGVQLPGMMSQGWSQRFANNMWVRGYDADFYEYSWGGFSDPFASIPTGAPHLIAGIGLRLFALLVWMKGYERIDVMGHSWGTTLTYDLLTGGGIWAENWVTMGSPLREGTNKPTLITRNWINVYSQNDCVTYFNMYPPFGSGRPYQYGDGSGLAANPQVNIQVEVSYGKGDGLMGLFGILEHIQYWNHTLTATRLAPRIK